MASHFPIDKTTPTQATKTMAQFREWIHTMHTTLDATTTKPTMTSYGYNNPASWTSDEDTESESEQSFRGFECRRKQRCAMRSKAKTHEPAAPVMIPSRTHDFGWCDQDDTRAQRVACPCGNDCDEFFSNDAQCASWSSSDAASPQEEANDDFIFDLEM